MRIIKFRGKSKSNGHWEYGDLLHDNVGGCYIYPIGVENLYKDNEVIPETVGQFTGLLDKNGNEVYEGDILKVRGTQEKIEVRFVRGVFAFLWNGKLDDEAPINAPTQEWAEVIGNIHDNPTFVLNNVFKEYKNNKIK